MAIRIVSCDSNRSTSQTYDNNRHLHLEKKGIRVFGVAESFNKFNTNSTLAGVVMRRDLIIDGIVFGSATLKGNDLNCIILGGLIISMYNIIDGKLIQDRTGLPVIGITFENSKGIEANIRYNFPDNYELKLEQYIRLGEREQVTLKTGNSVFIRCWGLTVKHAIALLDSFTLDGSIPEPIRVAKLVARAPNHSI